MSEKTLETSETLLDIEPVLNELVTRLCSSELPLAKIVLFGSYAAGIANKDSDIDLMIIVDNDDEMKSHAEDMQRYLSLWRLIRSINYEYAIDMKVYSHKEFERAKKFNRFFIKEIERTGRILYERVS
ncbi:MAG: nucleotidyltransferase domain-containing protein [Planctomycetaceae bacterium]|jgi:predicted nucleotidyltransferase|nr:nucleotidyltransferase domain-containing protein [Planctomycetaceae bacterium]